MENYEHLIKGLCDILQINVNKTYDNHIAMLYEWISQLHRDKYRLEQRVLHAKNPFRTNQRMLKYYYDQRFEQAMEWMFRE